jgi:hypothetical protein
MPFLPQPMRNYNVLKNIDEGALLEGTVGFTCRP